MTEMMAHPAAAIDRGAVLEEGVEVGPFAVIGPHVTLRKNAKIHSHAVVTGRTDIGEGCEIHPFAVVGGPPQDMKYRGERSELVVGAFTTIREHVTMNGGTEGGGHVTRVGSHGLFLAGAHVAHDCQIGNHVILVNNATLAGHVSVEDHAILGGLCAVHQFVRIGAYAFVGGMSGVESDVIPFGMVLGNRASLAGLNYVGLKRQSFDREQIHTLRKAYGLLFSQQGTLQERLDDVEKMFPEDAPVQRIVAFMRARTDRSFCVPRNQA
ncbi:MAG: acyl-ACP--UDP-N-acetylglucosamine O-acyltransferase [Rhodomicrobium sp.]